MSYSQTLRTFTHSASTEQTSWALAMTFRFISSIVHLRDEISGAVVYVTQVLSQLEVSPEHSGRSFPFPRMVLNVWYSDMLFTAIGLVLRWLL